ncbi:S41 family peptidase [Flavobacteriaceae bacterium]|nr:S41 family peptidase [Flavobacteriaceae bacterium]
MYKIYYYCFIGVAALLIGCDVQDRDDEIINISDTNPELEINDFIWKGLNQYYYWQEAVDSLADSKTKDKAAFAKFLGKTVDHSDFFTSLNHPDDRFSWIDEDYVNLENQLAGISASNGMKFLVSRQCDDCNGLVAFVTYVLPESDAAAKGIERGDFITTINGTSLNVNNYIDLLYGDALSYSVGLADYDPIEESFDLTGETITLDKVENFQEDPIHKNLVLDVGGQKVGYLMYNKFLNEFDDQLIQTFSDFATEGITDLVVDLRYNGGGSVRTCVYLASMITGQFTDEIFAQQIWNSKLLAYFEALNSNSNDSDDRELNNYFTSTNSEGVTLPALNLNTVYIIATNRSASASELLINGLAPHINVVLIGNTTYGKNVGSITVYDYIDNEGTKNPNHTYAMQPIVLKIANSVGFADYANGLDPDIEVRERASNLGVLGTPSEPLLSVALSQISGTGKYIIPQGEALVPLTDPEFDATNGMHIDLPQSTLKDFLKN